MKNGNENEGFDSGLGTAESSPSLISFFSRIRTHDHGEKHLDRGYC